MADVGNGAERAPADASIAADLTGLRLDEAMTGLQEHVQRVVTAQDQVHRLFDAVIAIASGLNMDATLRRIVSSAVELVGAKYGALGVLDARGGLSQFIHVGIEDATRAGLGHLPEGKGLLGELITDPNTLRLAELGDHPASVGFPPGHPPMHTFLGVPIRVRDTVYGNLYLTAKEQGAEFTTADEIIVEALAAAAGIAIENAKLYQQSELRQRWLEASADIQAKMLAGASEVGALQLIAERTRELLDARAVVILLGPGKAAGGSTVSVTSASDESILPGTEVDGEHPVIEHVSGGGGRVFLGECSPVEPPLLPGMDRAGPLMAVPMLAGGKPAGVVVVDREPGGSPFEPSDVPVLVSFAEVTVLAMELGRLNRNQQRMHVLADRDRIARDLHDKVIQRLFATGLQLQGASKRSQVPEVHARIATAVRELDGTVSDIRTAIFDLRAEDDAERGGLRRTLLDTVDAMASTADIVTSVRLNGPIDSVVSAERRLHVTAVVREAVSNAIRHSRATSLTATISVSAETLSVVVEDDGVGIDPGVARSGLRNLAERARSLGGILTDEHGPDGGTVLTWQVPIG